MWNGAASGGAQGHGGWGGDNWSADAWSGGGGHQNGWTAQQGHAQQWQAKRQRVDDNANWKQPGWNAAQNVGQHAAHQAGQQNGYQNGVVGGHNGTRNGAYSGHQQGSWGHQQGSQAWWDGWTYVPLSLRLGGPEWAVQLLNREPPCLSLSGQEPSDKRVERVRAYDFAGSLQKKGDTFVPAWDVQEKLFAQLLDGPRFPPDNLELAWCSKALKKPPEKGTGKVVLKKDDEEVPADIRWRGEAAEQEGPFKLLDNLADAPAQQPPHFKKYLLRPEQLRSLAWMLEREGYEQGVTQDGKLVQTNTEQEPFVAEWRQLWTCAWNAACLDMRVKASFNVRGGILADRVGYGKTATTIGLIDSTQHCEVPQVPEMDRGSFIPAKGTLVIVPSNLLDQWGQEISKFVWDGRRMVTLNSGWKASRTSDECPLKVIIIPTVSPLKMLMAGELADADVVLVSYRLLFSQIYQDRREDIAGGRSLSQLMAATRKVMEGTFPAPQSQVHVGNRLSNGQKGPQFYNGQTLVFPLIEMFYWRRVVFDEFHELESFQGAQQGILQHMRAHNRWGLTGTPPVEDISGVIFMSSLFRCDLPGYLPVEKMPAKKGSRQMIEVPNTKFYEGDRLMRRTCARFLDRFVRQNTAELPHIDLKQKLFVMRHTAAEKALYLGELFDTPGVQWGGADTCLTEGKLKLMQRLMKLCSHYQGGDSGGSGDKNGDKSAEAECNRVKDVKARKYANDRKQLARCARILQILKEKIPVRDDYENSPFAGWRRELDETEQMLRSQGRLGVAELEREEAAAAAEPFQDRCKFLAGHRPQDDNLQTALKRCANSEAGANSQRHWESFALSDFHPRELERLLHGQAREQANYLLSFCSSVGSRSYFDIVCKTLVERFPSSRACSVCNADNLGLEDMCIAECSHIFCEGCAQRFVEQQQRCSQCQQPLRPHDARPLSSRASPLQALCKDGSGISLDEVAMQNADGSKEAAKQLEFGTKLSVLVQKLQELREQDASAKVILFVQFDDLKNQVAAALREGGVITAQLKGSVSQRAGIIRDWQENPDSRTFVLLLSLAESASGTNLTAGSHVVFLHPMLAATPERAAAQELQAIGRARRHGQKRDTLHVWRFIMDGTVEQDITLSHQNTLQQHEDACKKRTLPAAEDMERELRKQRARALRNGMRMR
eukprot:TRINITY_DN18348_c0_g4_i2.p1 TRINITY_DN18348_c0_g4~~TRINITY_DN18348_c0_g4_i2.p1  ORF type:complete len:1172 (+),score=307.38 TRINITY_DN18348_c0_g4_i2:77-3592(+)